MTTKTDSLLSLLSFTDAMGRLHHGCQVRRQCWTPGTYLEKAPQVPGVETELDRILVHTPGERTFEWVPYRLDSRCDDWVVVE